MRTEIICRFASEEKLNEFNLRNNLNLNKIVKSYNVHTGETIYYKRNNKTPVSETKEYWETHWIDMPEYVSNKQEPYAKIIFYFNENDLSFANKFFNQSITEKTKSVWYPKLEENYMRTHGRVVGGNKEHRYPIYVVSKNRSDNCTTSKFLSQMEVKHFVVVEPEDYDKYIKKVATEYATILQLDMDYKKEYDPFDNLGDSKPKGPGAARNFCWDDSIKRGAEWHWVFDDNATEGFQWMYYNQKIKCKSGAWFAAIEDFVDRYDNIAQAGLNYTMFCKMSDKTPAFVMNTRIYSFLLIRNDIPYRWRGRYNEDTDLSLRVLKDGWCTVQFNAFLAGKVTTQKVKGGNTEEFYSKEGTYPKSKMLEDMHPDVAKVVWKFNRWHHQVDYSGFKQELHYREDAKFNPNQTINNYGMRIITVENPNMNDTKAELENRA